METAISVVGLLVSSTGSALLRKVLFQLEGVGIGTTVHYFLKPWFTTWESLAACAVSLLILHLQQLWTAFHRHLKSRRSKAAARQNGIADVEQPLLDSFSTKELQAVEETEQGLTVAEVTWTDLARLLVPATCSVFQIIVQGLGLAYISASTSMVLGGSAILFTAALSMLLLKCRLGKLHWAGIFLLLFGVSISAVANVIWPLPELDPALKSSSLPFPGLHTALQRLSDPELPESVYNTIMGVSLTLLSQLLLAGQLVAEEALLRSSTLHPLQVLGYEGLLGTIMVSIVGIPLTTFLPGADQGGMYENWADSCAMLWRTPAVGIVNAVFFVSVIGLNVFGVAVTCTLGSVFRAVLLTSRTALVWGVGLGLWEFHVGDGRVGEAWAYPTSQLQLIGFALVLLGTIIYAQGSSHVAMQYRAAKVAAAQAHDPSVHAATVTHATAHITRLHAYTSICIPPRAPLLRQAPNALRPRMSAPPAGSARMMTKGMMTSSFPATNLARASAPARSAIGINLPPSTDSWANHPGGQVAPLIHPEHNAVSQQNGELGSAPGSPVTRPVMTQPGMTHQGPPALGRPSFVNTLTHRSSWIMPKSHRMPQSGTLPDLRFASASTGGGGPADSAARAAQSPEPSTSAAWRQPQDGNLGSSPLMTNGFTQGGYPGPDMPSPFSADAGPSSSSPGAVGRSGSARPASADSALSHLLANAPPTLSGNMAMLQRRASQDSPRSNLAQPSSSGSSPVAIGSHRSFSGASDRPASDSVTQPLPGQPQQLSAASRGKISPLGQSPTPDVLIERRAARHAPFNPLPSHLEGCSSDDENAPDASAADEESAAESTAGDPAEASVLTEEAANVAAASDAASQEPPAGPRDSAHIQRASGSGLAMLLEDPSPHSVSNQTFSQLLARSRSNTPGNTTPGTPMTPAGQRVVTAATHAVEERASKAGLAGLLGEGPAGALGAPRAGRPPSLAAVAQKLQDNAGVGSGRSSKDT